MRSEGTVTSEEVTSNRADRRKARTRRALLDAAARLICEGRGARSSVHEITEAADVAFGSFYNHFDSKEELFHEATEEALDRWARRLDASVVGIDDSAEVLARALRTCGRLARTDPELAAFLVSMGLDVVDWPNGLAPRARRDILIGQSSGRFSAANSEIALGAIAGGLLRLLSLSEGNLGDVDKLGDDFAEACLRLLGVAGEESQRLVNLPLPDLAKD